MKTERKNYIITKRIAKHGSQAIIIIPRLLETELRQGTIVQVSLEVLGERK